MRYDLNDLLDEGQVEALTAEVFDHRRGGKRLWRRGLALAACAVLAVGLLNFEVIAAGVEKLFQYVAGVGAVELGADVVVQAEGEVSVSLGDRRYVVDGAYARDGVVYVPMDAVSKREETLKNGAQNGLYLRVSLYRDGTPLESGKRFEDGQWYPNHNPWALLSGTYEPLEPYIGNYLKERYLPLGYLSGESDVATFRLPDGMGPAGRYTVRLNWQGSDQSCDLPLTLAAPTDIGAHTDSRRVGEATVTAVVAPDGRWVSFFAELDAAHKERGERLIQLLFLPLQADEMAVYFRNAAGERQAGVLRRTGNGYHIRPEIVLMDEGFGPVTAIEIVSLEYNISLGTHASNRASQQRFPQYENLDWVITLN